MNKLTSQEAICRLEQIGLIVNKNDFKFYKTILKLPEYGSPDYYFVSKRCRENNNQFDIDFFNAAIAAGYRPYERSRVGKI